ncbi:MAG: DUF1924 domain-containing protein [Magnetococcales bacterium]|nr:DUF1924 domain-containing protein [Magnetococcales bacterium]NGZ05074.1 DUF1924 domain-containing protein [Magnetococcales bacterium]
MKKTSLITFALCALIGFSAHADKDDQGNLTAEERESVANLLAREYAALAQQSDPKAILSAEAGRAFYLKKVTVEGKEASCASCHTDNPKETGKHTETGKPIKPLAIRANPERFTNRDKTESNFAKHCRELYGKDCSPKDKGDYLMYLLTLK